MVTCTYARDAYLWARERRICVVFVGDLADRRDGMAVEEDPRYEEGTKPGERTNR